MTTLSSVNKEAFQNSLKSLVSKDDLIKGLDMWKNYDKVLAASDFKNESDRKNLIELTRLCCNANPLIPATSQLGKSIGFTDYQENEMQQLNPIWDIATKPDGAQVRIIKLIECLQFVRLDDCENLRREILERVPERNSVCQKIIDGW